MVPGEVNEMWMIGLCGQGTPVPPKSDLQDAAMLRCPCEMQPRKVQQPGSNRKVMAAA